MPNLNHFCDPEANAYPPISKKGEIIAFNPRTKSWGKVIRDWPIHDACSGQAIVIKQIVGEIKGVDEIVPCECDCHSLVVYP